MFNSKRLVLVSLSLASLLSTGLSQPAFSKNRVVEFVKYFNPIPEDSYTNESQDRVIKKRRFKFVEVPGATPVTNPELGYFGIVPFKSVNDESVIKELLAKNELNGISVILPWQYLEPVEFKYDWTKLDKIIELAKEAKKKVILRISTCGLDNDQRSDTPEWVFDAGAKSLEFYGTDGEKHLMPIFWDSTYLAKWSNFINSLGDRYDKNEVLHSVGITGGGILGSTKVVPNFVTLSKKKSDDKEESAKEEEKATDKEEQKEEQIDSSTKVKVDESESKESVEAKDDSETEKTAEEKTEKKKLSTDKKEEKAKSETEEDTDKVTETDSDEEDESTTAEVEEEDFDVESGPSRKNYRRLAKKLKKEFGMNERQLVEHWKYVADIFPNAFKVTRLNFDINPPIKGGKGQSGLDEISDYLIYRYGQRVYLTRQNIKNAKHGFNEYRILLKFHYDTPTGYGLSPDFKMKDITKLAKNALIDGISYMELPVQVLDSEEESVKTALEKIQSHMGYQLVSREVSIPKDAKVGAPLKTSFTFVNLGSASALNPKRELDKDKATSYKIQLEFRNSKGKPIMRSLHTPDIPTNKWTAGKPIIWEEELKMPELKPGKYEVFMSLIDTSTKHKLNFLNEVKDGELKAGTDAPVGSVELQK